MKKILNLTLASLLLVSFVGCDGINGNGPDVDPKDTTHVEPTKEYVKDDVLEEAGSFAKMQLLEHFTGEECGYCPDGMTAIWDYTQSHKNIVWVSHHVGYADDEYTVNGSNAIKTVCGVSGAPSVALNRAAAKYSYQGEMGSSTASAPAFHPLYLYGLSTVPADSTYASVLINNVYDKASRDLKVRVFGYVADETVTELKLTVLLKESGMVGHQKDYTNTFEGWEEFVHTNTVRLFLTSSLGMTLNIVDQKYDTTFVCTLDEKWVPEKMMAVAFLTNSKNKPVIQAAQKQLIYTTDGGESIKPEGIKVVPVSDVYPESGNPVSKYAGSDTISFSQALAYYYSYPDYGFNYWTIQAQSNEQYKVSGTPSVPVAMIQFFTETTVKSVPTATMDFGDDKVGNAYAGVRDDKARTVYGSELVMANYRYLNQGYLVQTDEWLLNKGTLELSPKGFTVKATSLAGHPITLIYDGTIVNQGQQRMPAKMPARYGVIAPELISVPAKPRFILF